MNRTLPYHSVVPIDQMARTTTFFLRQAHIVAFLATGLGLPNLARADETVSSGQALVELHCSRCHATKATGESSLPSAPRFRDLHLLYDVSFLEEALVEGITTAHPDMPEFVFDPADARAIIGYLKSLER